MIIAASIKEEESKTKAKLSDQQLRGSQASLLSDPSDELTAQMDAELRRLSMVAPDESGEHVVRCARGAIVLNDAMETVT